MLNVFSSVALQVTDDPNCAGEAGSPNLRLFDVAECDLLIILLLTGADDKRQDKSDCQHDECQKTGTDFANHIRLLSANYVWRLVVNQNFYKPQNKVCYGESRAFFII